MDTWQQGMKKCSLKTVLSLSCLKRKNNSSLLYRWRNRFKMSHNKGKENSLVCQTCSETSVACTETFRHSYWQDSVLEGPRSCWCSWAPAKTIRSWEDKEALIQQTPGGSICTEVRTRDWFLLHFMRQVLRAVASFSGCCYPFLVKGHLNRDSRNDYFREGKCSDSRYACLINVGAQQVIKANSQLPLSVMRSEDLQPKLRLFPQDAFHRQGCITYTNTSACQQGIFSHVIQREWMEKIQEFPCWGSSNGLFGRLEILELPQSEPSKFTVS